MRPEDGARKQIEIYRGMTGKQRLKIAMELYEVSRELISANIRNTYPGISEEEFQKKLIERMNRKLDSSSRIRELIKRPPKTY